MILALKEWAVVVEAIARKEHHYLLRKGGILDPGETFSLKAQEFWLYPTMLHQKKNCLKPAWQSALPQFSLEAVPLQVQVKAGPALLIKSLDDFKAIEPRTIWSEDYALMRLNYKPEKPLYAIPIEAWLAPRPIYIKETPEYAGCISWVEVKGSELDRLID
jgi:hypothetical protein